MSSLYPYVYIPLPILSHVHITLRSNSEGCFHLRASKIKSRQKSPTIPTFFFISQEWQLCLQVSKCETSKYGNTVGTANPIIVKYKACKMEKPLLECLI